MLFYGKMLTNLFKKVIFVEFSYILSNNILSDIDVSIFSYQVLEANTTIKPSKRSYYTFCFINDGKAIFNNEKTQFMLKKNQGILIFPNSVLNYSVSADSPLQIITLGFFGISAPNFIEQTKSFPKGRNLAIV